MVPSAMFEDAIPEVYATRMRLLGQEPTPEEIFTRIAEENVEFINLQITDVMGMVKSVTIPARLFPDIVERGQWIDGSSIA